MKKAVWLVPFTFVICAGSWVGYALATRSGSELAASSSSDIPIGQPAPDFTLPDLHGHKFTLSAQKGHPVVLGFFCGCNRCHTAALKIAALQREGKMRSFVGVVAMDPSGTREFQKSTGLGGAILSDPSDATAERYDSDYCPRLWAMSAAGNIDYRSDGALEGAALRKALNELRRRS